MLKAELAELHSFTVVIPVNVPDSVTTADESVAPEVEEESKNLPIELSLVFGFAYDGVYDEPSVKAMPFAVVVTVMVLELLPVTLLLYARTR